MDEGSKLSDESFSGDEPPLVGRRVRLVPANPDHTEFLYVLLTEEAESLLWRFGGTTPSPDAFVASLWNKTLAIFLIQHVSDGSPIGVVWAYGADFRNGHAHVGLTLRRAFRKGLYAHDANLLFINYVFTMWNLRKLYGEVSERNLRQFERLEDSGVKVEGVLKEHIYYGNRYWDLYTTAIYRETWKGVVARQLPLVLERPLGTRGADSPGPARAPR